jgi:hypothetical protein
LFVPSALCTKGHLSNEQSETVERSARYGLTIVVVVGFILKIILVMATKSTKEPEGVIFFFLSRHKGGKVDDCDLAASKMCAD